VREESVLGRKQSAERVFGLGSLWFQGLGRWRNSGVSLSESMMHVNSRVDGVPQTAKEITGGIRIGRIDVIQ